MINIVTALMAEAKPLIDRFNLTPMGKPESYKVFQRGDITCIVSGIGKVNSAGACGYLYALNGSLRQSAWLNIGIAGHQNCPVGRFLRVDQLIDQSTKQKFYPQNVLSNLCKSDRLITVDRAEMDYHQNALYDMEATGFFATTNRFSSAELISVYKIVSDNQTTNISEVIHQKIDTLIEDNMDDIEQVVHQLNELSRSQIHLMMEPKEYKEILAYCHFTTTQKRELLNLLKKWKLVNSKESFLDVLKDFETSDEILEHMRQSLIEQPLEL